MSRKRRNQVNWIDFEDCYHQWVDFPEKYNSDWGILKAKRFSKENEKGLHSYNRNKNKTKHRCYKLTLTKAKRSGYKIPDPTLSEIWYYKHHIRKHSEKRQIEEAQAQIEEFYKEE